MLTATPEAELFACNEREIEGLPSPTAKTSSVTHRKFLACIVVLLLCSSEKLSVVDSASSALTVMLVCRIGKTSAALGLASFSHGF
jgi:hypothetical protein